MARVLGWGAYLAVSWTWCIGMYLPVMLVRDLGVWAFAAFAAPNVIGAAGMGWVLRREGSSERIVREHGPALRWFSLATIAFQVFFGTHLLAASGHVATAAGALIGASIAGVVLRRALPVFAVIVLGGSVAALAGFGGGSPTMPALEGEVGPALLLLPGFAFGFALCPYLDLTFHRARRSVAGGAGTTAFVVGFGVMFLAMILGTLAYSTALAGGAFPAVIVAHMGVQLAATIVLHEREVMREGRGGAGGVWAAAAIGAGAAGLAATGAVEFERVYLGFLGLYACVFPVYAWVCMIGHRGHRAGPTRAKMAIVGVTFAVVAPLFWLALAEGRTALAVPAAGLLLASRLGLRVVRGR